MWRLRNLVLLLSILAVKPASAQFWVELFQSPEFLDHIKVNDSTYLEGSVRMTGLSGSGGTLMIDAEGDLYEAAAGGVSGLDSNLILFGSTAGGIEQDTDFVFTNNYLGAGIGKGIELTDDTLPYIYLEATAPWASEIGLQGNSIIRWRSSGGSSHWLMEYDDTDGSLGIHNNTSSQDFRLYGGSSVQIYSDTLVKLYDAYAGNKLEIDSNNIRFTVDSLYTTSRFVGVGTTIPEFNLDIREDGRVEVVGTGYGTAKTVFGARYANGTKASPTAITTGQDIGEFGFGGYKASAFSVSATAYMKGISTENWTDAATGTKLEFSVNPNTTTGSVAALTIDQDRNLQLERKIEEYNNAAITDGQLLIGNTGTSTFDAATITAGSGITITNGAGTITIAETNEADGTWSPSTGATANVDAVSYNSALYHRSGSIVNWAISVNIDATTAGATLTTVRFSPPVASNFGDSYDNIGSGRIVGTATTTIYSSSDSTTDEIVIGFPAGTTSAQDYHITGTYEIK